MKELQQRFYKHTGKYDWTYMWLVENSVNQWELLHISSKYQLFDSIGKRGAAIENGELTVDSLSQHTFEGYIEFCQDRISDAQPFAKATQEFSFNVSIDLANEDNKYRKKALEALIKEHGFNKCSDFKFDFKDAQTNLLLDDCILERYIEITPRIPLPTIVDNIVEELLIPGIPKETKNMKQLSIF